jgi:hypothetical protein
MIEGVTDPDGDAVTIVATAITQDESSDEWSDGGACPDAVIGPAGPVYLHAEGSPSGNGRVYRIKFIATVSRGASCTGTVEVCVPLVEGGTCSDDGQTVSSTQACLGGFYAPTTPVIDELRCGGTVLVRGPGGVLSQQLRTVLVTEPAPAIPTGAPQDTCPSGSRVDVAWHAEPPTAIGYRYRIDDRPFAVVGADVVTASFGTLLAGVPSDTTPVAPETRVFTLQALNQETGSPDATRRFQMNFSPDTWLAGPDPNAIGGPWQIKPNGEKYVLLVNGQVPPGGLPGSLMSPDSVEIMPLDRVPHRTFLEIYRDTVFLRQEYDTVHKGAWVVFHNGGFDPDSRYRVHVSDPGSIPGFPGGPVLTPGPANGSPVGFRSRMSTFLAPSGPIGIGPQSSLYPFFDPNSVQHSPRIAAYHPAGLSGKAYAVQRAEDGDGSRDGRILGGEEHLIGEDPTSPLRPLVMVFFVDYPPVLLTSDPLFRPRVDVVDTFDSRTWDLRTPGMDPDPYEPGNPIGGPTAEILRLRYTVTGTDTQGGPLVLLDPAPNESQQKYVNVSEVNLTVPATLASGPATLTVELCDCAFCELNPGSGRCITRDIPVNYVAPPLSAASVAARAGSDATAGVVATSLRVPLGRSSGGNVAIDFDLATAGQANLDVYNVAGQRVRRLVSAWYPDGRHASTWDRRDDRGREVGPGVYFARLRAVDAMLTRKFFVTR